MENGWLGFHVLLSCVLEYTYVIHSDRHPEDKVSDDGAQTVPGNRHLFPGDLAYQYSSQHPIYFRARDALFVFFPHRLRWSRFVGMGMEHFVTMVNLVTMVTLHFLSFLIKMYQRRFYCCSGRVLWMWFDDACHMEMQAVRAGTPPKPVNVGHVSPENQQTG